MAWIVPSLRLAAVLLVLAVCPVRAAEAAVPRTVAVGNVHGAFEPFTALLRATGLVDDRLAWSGGRDHLVLLGDLLDHGPRERDVLELVMRLETEAAAAGGGVDLVLGEHELMNLAGDFRRVSPAGFAAFAAEEPAAERKAARARYLAARRGPNAAAFDQEYPRGWFARRAAFASGGRYGDYLASKPLLLVRDGTLFVHGGIAPALDGPPKRIQEQASADVASFLAIRARLLDLGLVDPETRFLDLVEVANERLMDRGRQPGLGAPETVAAGIADLGRIEAGPAFGTGGPAWYSGWSAHREADARAAFDAALARAGAVRAVVAHWPTRGAVVTSRFGGRLLCIDTGMLREVFRGGPAALVLVSGHAGVVQPGAPAAEPVADDDVVRNADPAAADHEDRALETILRDGTVVAIEDAGPGTTHPLRITLRLGGVTRRALFKTVSRSIRGRVHVGTHVESGFSDDYRHEVAAYRIDRLIGLDMVPVTVERTIDGRRGSLQAWVENAIDEQHRLAAGLEPEDEDAQQRAIDASRLFDVLIANDDRNLGNRIYTLHDWRMYLIDHSRSFRPIRGQPDWMSDRPIEITDRLAAGLASLTRERLVAAVGALLDAEQVDAILVRRDELLAGRAKTAK